MIRIILFLLLIALGAAGAAWVAEQAGDFVLTWGTLRLKTTFPVFVLISGIAIAAAIMLWAILRGLWRTPERIQRGRRRAGRIAHAAAAPADRAPPVCVRLRRGRAHLRNRRVLSPAGLA